jgi:hypothetical protein
MRDIHCANVHAGQLHEDIPLHPNPLPPAPQAISQQIKESVGHMRVLALVAPFAAMSGSADTFFVITKAVASFIKVSLCVCVCWGGGGMSAHIQRTPYARIPFHMRMFRLGVALCAGTFFNPSRA